MIGRIFIIMQKRTLKIGKENLKLQIKNLIIIEFQ